MMLLETPPGQHPTRMSPAAMPRGSPQKCTSRNATSGMMVYCAQAPMKISSGLRASMRKSSGRSVMPMVSITTPRMAVCVFPCTQENAPGRKNATTAAAMTKGEV